MSDQTRLVVIGVDGLDFDLINNLGSGVVPALHELVAGSQPHTSTFPPDSVPSWTSIFTGLAPHEHAQLHSTNFLLDGATEATAGVSEWSDRLFWESAADPSRVAVLNPFLAYPPAAPGGLGAMASGPPFSEGIGEIDDPGQRLPHEVPRMGGFSWMPEPKELERFERETAAVAADQNEYFLRAIKSGQFSMVFATTLIVDRLQHVFWRFHDSDDPYHPGESPFSGAVVAAHKQLDDFVAKARAEAGEGHRIVLMSDHGHRARAHIGVNLHEYFRRLGLYRVEHSSRLAPFVEAAKTAAMSLAIPCHVEQPLIRLARRVPARKALKSGDYVGRPSASSAVVPDVAGSNPWGGIEVGGDDALAQRVIEALGALRHRGDRPVVSVVHRDELLPAGAAEVFPDLLIEFDPRYAPTWNLYGPVFAPIITRRRISGGHSRRAIFATNSQDVTPPTNSTAVHGVLTELMRISEI